MALDVMSDETFDQLCRVCTRKVRNVAAEKYCVECQDYFCITCVKVHEDIPILSGHQIVDKDQLSPGTSKGAQGSSQSQPAVPTEKCDRHSHFIIDTYCYTHDDVGCAACMAVDHRVCRTVFYIPELIQTNISVPDHVGVKDKLDLIATLIDEHRKELQREKDQVLEKKAGILENIRKIRKEVNERLNELEKNYVADLEDKYKILINKIEEGIKILDANKVNVTSAQDKLESPDTNVSQDFVNAKKGNNIVSNVSECIEQNIIPIHAEDIDLTPDLRIPELLRQICTFVQGNMRITEPKVPSDVLFQTEGDQTYSGTAPQTGTLLYAEASNKYHVKIESDESDCDIVSACALEDGTIVLSDFNNRNLKRLDSSTYKVKDSLDLPGYPWQVSPFSKQDVAVCLTDKAVVQFISVGESKMKTTKLIKTDFDCWSVACAEDNLYISDCYTSVYVYNVSGSKLKQFSYDQLGQELFSYIISMSVSKDGSKIYVSDWDNGLIVLDNNGQLVGRFDGPELETAFGCCLTDTGSLLVCGMVSNNVLQFGINGDLKNEVLEFKEQNTCHKAICCNRQMSKVLIGRDENEIEVYDIVKHSE